MSRSTDAGGKVLGVSLLALGGTKWIKEVRTDCVSFLCCREKLILTFRIGFRRRWKYEGRCFSPLPSPSPPSSWRTFFLSWWGQSCALRKVLPTGSPLLQGISSLQHSYFRVDDYCRQEKGSLKESGVSAFFLLKARVLPDSYTHGFSQLFKANKSSESICLKGVDSNL